FNLVTSAVRNGRRVIGVVLGATSGHRRDVEMMALLDRGLDGATGTMVAKAADVAPESDEATNGGEESEAEELATTVAVATGGAEPVSGAAVEEPPQGSIGEAWGIQVGAFTDHEGAASAVVRALRRQPRLLADAETVIVPVAADKGVFYRARLYGLSEEQARSACVALRTRK